MQTNESENESEKRSTVQLHLEAKESTASDVPSLFTWQVREEAMQAICSSEGRLLVLREKDPFIKEHQKWFSVEILLHQNPPPGKIQLDYRLSYGIFPFKAEGRLPDTKRWLRYTLTLREKDFHFYMEADTARALAKIDFHVSYPEALFTKHPV